MHKNLGMVLWLSVFFSNNHSVRLTENDGVLTLMRKDSVPTGFVLRPIDDDRSNLAAGERMPRADLWKFTGSSPSWADMKPFAK